MIKKSVLDFVGNTPMIEIEIDNNSSVFAKLEYFNPAGSIKDRVAKYMIKEGFKNGSINENSVIIEPTSGNTGIGLAMAGASLGLKVIIVMPSSMTKERILLMQSYGAEVILTEGALGMKGAITKAEEIKENTPNSIIAGQFYNPANILAHYETTGPEIWSQSNHQVDYFVAGIGTGGTVSGVGKYLKEQNKSIKIIGVEPESSPLITKGIASSHKIQGIGANFIPENFIKSVPDEVVTVTHEESLEACEFLAHKKGILVGISAGANFAIAKKIALTSGKNVVTVFPDGGEKYLSLKNN